MGGLSGDGDHHEHHGQHHQAHQNLKAVHKQGGQLAHGEGHALGADDEVGTQPQDEAGGGVEAELHQGGVKGHDALGPGEVPAHIFGGGGELLLLKVLPDVALHHPHGLHVLLDGVVQGVVLAEHLDKQGMYLADDNRQTDGQYRDGEQEDEGHGAAHDVGHDKGKDQHQGKANGAPDDHHKGHLHVGHVGGHTGDQRRGGKAVNVGKGEVLNVVEHIPSQIPGIAGGCGCGGGACNPSKEQGKASQHHENHTVADDGGQLTAILDFQNQIGGEEGDDTFDDDFQSDKQGGQ